MSLGSEAFVADGNVVFVGQPVPSSGLSLLDAAVDTMYTFFDHGKVRMSKAPHPNITDIRFILGEVRLSTVT